MCNKIIDKKKGHSPSNVLPNFIKNNDEILAFNVHKNLIKNNGSPFKRNLDFNNSGPYTHINRILKGK